MRGSKPVGLVFDRSQTKKDSDYDTTKVSFNIEGNPVLCVIDTQPILPIPSEKCLLAKELTMSQVPIVYTSHADVCGNINPSL